MSAPDDPRASGRIAALERFVALHRGREDRAVAELARRRAAVGEASEALAAARTASERAEAGRVPAERRVMARLTEMDGGKGGGLSVRALAAAEAETGALAATIDRALAVTEERRLDLADARVSEAKAAGSLTEVRRERERWTEIRDEAVRAIARGRILAEERDIEDEVADRFGAMRLASGAAG